MLCKQLGRQLSVAADGPLDQQREEGRKQVEPEEIRLSLCLIPVHVDNIARGLEHIKGDAKGQSQGQEGMGPQEAGLAEKEQAKIQQ